MPLPVVLVTLPVVLLVIPVLLLVLMLWARRCQAPWRSEAAGPPGHLGCPLGSDPRPAGWSAGAQEGNRNLVVTRRRHATETGA